MTKKLHPFNDFYLYIIKCDYIIKITEINHDYKYFFCSIREWKNTHIYVFTAAHSSIPSGLLS